MNPSVLKLLLKYIEENGTESHGEQPRPMDPAMVAKQDALRQMIASQEGAPVTTEGGKPWPDLSTENAEKGIQPSFGFEDIATGLTPQRLLQHRTIADQLPALSKSLSPEIAEAVLGATRSETPAAAKEAFAGIKNAASNFSQQTKRYGKEGAAHNYKYRLGDAGEALENYATTGKFLDDSVAKKQMLEGPKAAGRKVNILSEGQSIDYPEKIKAVKYGDDIALQIGDDEKDLAYGLNFGEEKVVVVADRPNKLKTTSTLRHELDHGNNEIVPTLYEYPLLDAQKRGIDMRRELVDSMLERPLDPTVKYRSELLARMDEANLPPVQYDRIASAYHHNPDQIASSEALNTIKSVGSATRRAITNNKLNRLHGQAGIAASSDDVYRRLKSLLPNDAPSASPEELDNSGVQEIASIDPKISALEQLVQTSPVQPQSAFKKYLQDSLNKKVRPQPNKRATPGGVRG